MRGNNIRESGGEEKTRGAFEAFGGSPGRSSKHGNKGRFEWGKRETQILRHESATGVESSNISRSLLCSSAPTTISHLREGSSAHLISVMRHLRGHRFEGIQGRRTNAIHVMFASSISVSLATAPHVTMNHYSPIETRASHQETKSTTKIL